MNVRLREDTMRTQMTMLALAAGAALAAPAMGQNLLGNGSFETVGTGFDEFADWGVFNSAFADGPADISNEVTAQDGVRSLKTFGGFFGTGVQSDNGAFQRVPVTGGTEYTLSAYTQMLAADPLKLADFTDPNGDFGHLPLLIIDFYATPGSGTPIGGGSAEVVSFVIGTDPTDTWVQKTVTTTAPATAVEAQVTLLLIQWGDDPGSLFWDNISLEAGDGPVAGCNPADCDGNGILNIDDVDCFVSNFLAGCP